MLRCIKAGVNPASCRLKNTIKTPKSILIIRKAERQLLNERVRNINETLYYSELRGNHATTNSKKLT